MQGAMYYYLIPGLVYIQVHQIRCFQISVIHTMAKPVPQPTTVVAINVTTSAVNPNIIFSSFDCCCFVFLLFFFFVSNPYYTPPFLAKTGTFLKFPKKIFQRGFLSFFRHTGCCKIRRLSFL